jgi:hypothetical protein
MTSSEGKFPTEFLIMGDVGSALRKKHFPLPFVERNMFYFMFLDDWDYKKRNKAFGGTSIKEEFSKFSPVSQCLIPVKADHLPILTHRIVEKRSQGVAGV